jgi:hypothetical protein
VILRLGRRLLAHRIRIIKHEAVPKCGSYEVKFPDGRASKFFYFEDIAGRRLKPDQADSKQALEEAQAFARAERDRA